MRSPLVLKFGGATLGTEERLRRVLQMVTDSPRPPVVVVSAREGVTDMLHESARHPGDRKARDRLAKLLTQLHEGVPEVLSTNLSAMDGELRRISRIGAASEALTDSLVARGERLSVHWFANRLKEAGIDAVPLEADELGLRTDGNHGSATIKFDLSRERVKRTLESCLGRGVVPVVTGFIGRGPDGKVTTLGRGGSDYTATSLGSMLKAEEIVLVKTNVSLFTADPRMVPGAFPITHLSYEEAEELAQFGARVLHPLTVEPARQNGVRVTVRSLDRPELSTTIGPAQGSRGVRAMTLLTPVSLLLFRVPGGRQRKGVIANVAQDLSRAGVNIITLFTSSAILCILVEAALGHKARDALKPLVLRNGTGASLEGPTPVALVTAIGEGIASDIGNIPQSLTRMALGISGTTQTLSVAVPVEGGREALVTMHRVLVEKHPSVR